MHIYQIRTKIWQTLPYDDLLSLRLTSKFTKADVDTFVGLNGRISATDTEKFDFYQRIALQSCKITELQTPIDQDFFLNPSVLQHLEIREYTPIPLENIQEILTVCINLKHLKLRLTLNENTSEISQVILEALPYMKGLSFLHVKTKSRYLPDVKEYSSGPSFSFNSPKRLKTLHLEMPDLPGTELARWKVVIDKQICLESATLILGNVSWRFYETLMTANAPTLERVILEGIRGWNYERNREDPFDWNVFSAFVKLKTIDFSCNRGGGHDILETVNFEKFPCATIEEFFISRVMLSPEAVERVYTQMVRLQRGALDHIGHEGIARANEMAWVIQQNEHNADNDGWWQDERLWDLLAHSAFAFLMTLSLTYVLKRRNGNSGIYDEALEIFGAFGDDMAEPGAAQP